MKLLTLAISLCVPSVFCSDSPPGPARVSSLLSPIVARLRRAARPDQSARQNFFRRFKRAIFAKILKKLADFRQRLAGKEARGRGYRAGAGGRDAGASPLPNGSEFGR